MGTENVDFIKVLICAKSVYDAPKLLEISLASGGSISSHHVFMKTKNEAATWSHAIVPPSGGASVLTLVGLAGSRRGGEPDFFSRKEDESGDFPPCPARVRESIRARGGCGEGGGKDSRGTGSF
jgi:hypothetical protein